MLLHIWKFIEIVKVVIEKINEEYWVEVENLIFYVTLDNLLTVEVGKNRQYATTCRLLRI